MLEIIRKLGERIQSKTKDHTIDCKTILRNPRRGSLLARNCLQKTAATDTKAYLDGAILDCLLKEFSALGFTTSKGARYPVHIQTTHCDLPAVFKPGGGDQWLALDIIPLDSGAFAEALAGGQKWIRDSAQLMLAVSQLPECLSLVINQETGQLSAVLTTADSDHQLAVYNAIAAAIETPPGVSKDAPLMLDCGPIYWGRGTPAAVCCANCYHSLFKPAKGWLCALQDQVRPIQGAPQIEKCAAHLFTPGVMPWLVVEESPDGVAYDLDWQDAGGMIADDKTKGVIWNIPDTGADPESKKFTSDELAKLASSPDLLADDNINSLRVNFGAIPN